MSCVRDEQDSDAQAELDEAYGLLREFWVTIENSMESAHPAKARLDRWLSRYEAAVTLRGEE